MAPPTPVALLHVAVCKEGSVCARPWGGTCLHVHPSIFVGIPNIAQKHINKAKLSVEGIKLTNTESQNYTMEINSTIKASSPVPAKLDPFKGVMYLEDLEPHTPFVEVDFPETTSEDNQKVNVSQFVSITNMEAFTTFNAWLLTNNSLRVTVKGDTKVKVKGIAKKFKVHFKKTITMPGMSLRNWQDRPGLMLTLHRPQEL